MYVSTFKHIIYKYIEFLTGLECADGICKKQLPYFTVNEDSDMSLLGCVIYLAVTPLIYFALLIILEEGLLNKLHIKMFGQNLSKGCEMKDDQVEREKLMVSLEIGKLKDRGMVSLKMKFISLNLLKQGIDIRHAFRYNQRERKSQDNLCC